MRFSILLGLAALCHLSAAADEKPPKPCTAVSPNTGAFFDLSSVALKPLAPGKTPGKKDKTESWHARGFDYGHNFTLNICEPVMEDIKDVVGVKDELWQNVSAYYTQDEKIYSIGQQNSEPIFRGRKLVLNYTDGSPCGDDDKRRKSSLISFHCEKDTLAAPLTASFVGTSPDQCTYFFEARSQAACASTAPAPDTTLGPGGVFGVIVLIAIIVYFVGGVVYNRSVVNARGWRQLPNYGMWAGIGGFIKVGRDLCLFCFRRVSVLCGKKRRVRGVRERDGLLPVMEPKMKGRFARSHPSKSPYGTRPP